MRSWEQSGQHPNLAVAVSVRSLQNPDFVASARPLLTQAGFLQGHLQLDVTDTVHIRDLEFIRLLMQDLLELGVSLRLDHFGASYTSLSTLRILPLREVRLDASYATSLPQDPQGQAITAAMIRLGHSLGFKVVAAGVWDAATMECLQLLDCDAALGAHLGQAMAAEDVLPWMNQRAAAPASATAAP